MSNLLSYLEWRGDLTFEERPFCDVDNLVLAELSYLDFTGIVPTIEDGGSILLKDALTQYLNSDNKAKLVGDIGKEFINALLSSKRYANIRCKNYKDLSDVEGTNTDFAALWFVLTDQTVYIAFRGTGNELIGWREDFSMSFQLMPAQRLAEKYIQDTYDTTYDNYYFGGHSKGGNLAVYAAATASSEVKDKILTIYSNDGPGFCDDVIGPDLINTVREKIVRIVPEFSVIGSLFETKNVKKIIVKSSKQDINSHDGMTWQVNGDGFVTVEEHTKECVFYNEVLANWIESGDLEYRKQFVNDFFDALEKNGANNFTDLYSMGVDDFLSILISVTGSDDKTLSMMRRFAKTVLNSVRNININDFFKAKMTLLALGLFFLGLFITVSPKVAASVVGSAMGVAGVVLVVKRMFDTAFKDQGTIDTRKMKMVVQVSAICLIMYLIAQRQILAQISNIVIGFAFLFFAYRWLVRSFAYPKLWPKKLIGFGITAAAFALGIVPILLTNITFGQYMRMVGISMWVYGVGLFIDLAYKNGKEQLAIARKREFEKGLK